MKTIELITDGACIGNPGRGGWACILRFGGQTTELYGSASYTTNNRMELTAAVKGIEELDEPCEVEVTTDSEYLKNGITKWIIKWKQNGWRTADKKPVLNQDLWQELDELVARHKVTWKWTRGHSSHTDNNRCDELATMAAREQSSSRR